MVGVKIGQGHKLDDVLGEMRMVAEGVKTARSVYNLSKRLSVEMPICHAVYHTLYEDLSPKDARIPTYDPRFKKRIGRGISALSGDASDPTDLFWQFGECIPIGAG